MDVKLVFFKPDGARREVSLKPGRWVVGRSSSAALRVPVSSISRSHAELLLDERGLRIRDLGSLNGTFHNGQRVDEEELVAAGDFLRMGEVHIGVQINGEPSHIEPPLDADLTDSSMMEETPASVAGGDIRKGGSGKSRSGSVRIDEDEETVTRRPGPATPANEDSSVFDFDFDFEDDESGTR